jgi:hypothetical protein
MPSPQPQNPGPAAPQSLAARAEAFLERLQSGKWPHRLFVAAVLLFTFAVRILLVERGGQHFFYDEGKFGTAKEAAAILAKGHVVESVVYAIEPHPSTFADHIGFKILGMVPSLVEARFGLDDRVPAYFFSIFSALNVVLIAAIAYRLSGSRRAFDLTLLAASLSATLFIYTRFLVPYDVSMFFALLSIWVGVKRPASYLRSAFVGILAAWSFFCYYGHWQIFGAAVLVHGLWLANTPLDLLKRFFVAGLGAVAVVLALLGISHLGAGTLLKDMVEITKYQNVGSADFRSGINSWIYFFYGERAALFIWVAAIGCALWLQFRGDPKSGRKFLTPLTVIAAGFLAIYAVFIIDSDIRQSLIVHGRHSRQLVPFLILGFGLGWDKVCERSRQAHLLAAVAGGALVLNAFWTFPVPLAQEFPLAFKARAERLLATLPPITDGGSYYRLVNVDHFVLEPEILRNPPMETLLASPHPLQYMPYLYEGGSRAEKRLRLSIDHRMRLVRMAIPENERIHGDPYGVVKLTVAFPDGRAGYTEPLLSVGAKGNGDLFFVNYTTASTAVLGYVNMGRTLIRSAPFPFTPGQPRELRLFSGALMPADEELPIAGLSQGGASILRESVYATLDGKVMLDEPVARHTALPGEVYAGVNTVEADSAGAQFSGRILDATRGGWPPEPKGAGNDSNYGPVHLRITQPVPSGTAEPLVIAGIPGRAVLGYMRLFADGHTIFGIEIWGEGVFEGKPLNLEPGKQLDVEYSFGSLYPGIGLPAWGALPLDAQRKLKGTVRITVNGEVALDIQKETPDLTGLPVVFAKNKVGGNVVNAGFSGELLLGRRVGIGK